MVDIKEIGNILNMWNVKRKFSAKRGDFYTDMSDALRDGEAVMDYLEKRKKRAFKRKDPLAPMLKIWCQRLGETGNFSQSINSTVPAMDVMILHSSETTGRLDQGLAFLAKTVEESRKMRSAVIGAISMPVFLCFMLIGILYGFTFFMVPILSAVIDPSDWTASAKLLYSISQLIQHYGVFMFMAIVGAIGTFKWSLENWIQDFRFQLDKFPPYSIFRDTNAAIFLVTLASLLKAGISVGDALKNMRNYANPWMKLHISKMIWQLDRKGSAAQALSTGLLSYELSDRVEDYGERSSFQEAIDMIGFKAIDIVTRKVTITAKFLNTLGLLMVGGSLGFIILSVLTTAQQAQNTIQSSM